MGTKIVMPEYHGDCSRLAWGHPDYRKIRYRVHWEDNNKSSSLERRTFFERDFGPMVKVPLGVRSHLPKKLEIETSDAFVGVEALGRKINLNAFWVPVEGLTRWFDLKQRELED